MRDVKRVEIITNTRTMRKVCDVLESRGITGYSVMHAVTGSGDRGLQAGDELSDAFSNSCLITAFPPEQLSEIVEAVRPILRHSGGVCLVSDAQWVIH
jgi:nitrogen regulatory protein PII